MTQLKKGKLNSMLTSWPNGTAIACSWLHKKGYGYDLIKVYRDSGWVYPIGQGAIGRAGDRVDWTGGLYAIQTQLDLPIHPGGKTALQLHGHQHFIPMRKGWLVTLYGQSEIKPPTWFLTNKWNVKIRYTTASPFPEHPRIALTEKNMGTYRITLSSPERAAMEMFHLVPNKEDFEETALIFDSLSTLRPRLIQQLLEKCCSDKVKRLFLFHAERANHPWFKKLNLGKVNLGSSKRVIVKNGKFDKKYRITVPGEFTYHAAEKTKP